MLAHRWRVRQGSPVLAGMQQWDCFNKEYFVINRLYQLVISPQSKLLGKFLSLLSAFIFIFDYIKNTQALPKIEKYKYL